MGGFSLTHLAIAILATVALHGLVIALASSAKALSRGQYASRTIALLVLVAATLLIPKEEWRFIALTGGSLVAELLITLFTVYRLNHCAMSRWTALLMAIPPLNIVLFLFLCFKRGMVFASPPTPPSA